MMIEITAQPAVANLQTREVVEEATGRRVQRAFADVAIVLPDAGVLMLRGVSLAALGNRTPRVARVILEAGDDAGDDRQPSLLG
jgi:hypothetical protein